MYETDEINRELKQYVVRLAKHNKCIRSIERMELIYYIVYFTLTLS